MLRCFRFVSFHFVPSFAVHSFVRSFSQSVSQSAFFRWLFQFFGFLLIPDVAVAVLLTVSLLVSPLITSFTSIFYCPAHSWQLQSNSSGRNSRCSCPINAVIKNNCTHTHPNISLVQSALSSVSLFCQTCGKATLGYCAYSLKYYLLLFVLFFHLVRTHALIFHSVLVSLPAFCNTVLYVCHVRQSVCNIHLQEL